jgi:hypothetical protein
VIPIARLAIQTVKHVLQPYYVLLVKIQILRFIQLLAVFVKMDFTIPRLWIVIPIARLAIQIVKLVHQP